MGYLEDFEIDYFEERSAILQFCEGFTRERAEKEALKRILEERNKKIPAGCQSAGKLF